MPNWPRIAIGGGGGMFVAMGLGRFSYTAMVPALIASGALSPVEAGRVGTVNFIGFFLGAAGSVSLGRWMSRQRLLIVAVIAAVLGLAGSAMAVGFHDLAACRGVIGLATGVIMVNSLALIAETAPPHRRAVAGSFVFAGVGLGILSSAIIVPALLSYGVTATWWVLAIAGVSAAGLALWGWWRAPLPPAAGSVNGSQRDVLAAWPMRGLLVAHFLFSMGIAPHSVYWVDFLVRELSLGFAAGGAYWSVVGVFAFLGPLICAALASATGTAVALVLAFVALGCGIAAPGLMPVTAVLLTSSILFGAQPGVSALMAARARDLGDPASMGRVMRAMILANAIGAVVGGALVPWVYGVLGTQGPLFLIGGAAMLVAALAAWPYTAVRAAA